MITGAGRYGLACKLFGINSGAEDLAAMGPAVGHLRQPGRVFGGRWDGRGSGGPEWRSQGFLARGAAEPLHWAVSATVAQCAVKRWTAPMR